jgi:hypothetical protein
MKNLQSLACASSAIIFFAGCAEPQKAGPPTSEQKIVEFTQTSENDIPTRMDQWQREGWSVVAISGPIPQSDGTVHRRAELRRAEPTRTEPTRTEPTHFATVAPPKNVYDDSRISRIKKGETTENELLNWFGPPEARDLKPDGHAQLSWAFEPILPGHQGGALNVSLGPDGKVEAYSARK